MGSNYQCSSQDHDPMSHHPVVTNSAPHMRRKNSQFILLEFGAVLLGLVLFTFIVFISIFYFYGDL